MSSTRSQVQAIPVDLIAPGAQQARRRFDAAALAELAGSIRESGVIQPVVLRTRGDGYELLAGERRWRAAQAAGLHEIPAIVRDDLSDDEAFVVGLIENLQRESLSPMETAFGLKRLGEHYRMTHAQIGERIGKSREYVSNFLRLLGLAPAVQEQLNRGELSIGHGKVLAGLPAERQPQLARACVEGGWSVRALERRLLPAAGTASAARSAVKTADWARLERELSDSLGYPSTLLADDQGRGELRIRFHSLDELEGLLERLRGSAPR